MINQKMGVEYNLLENIIRRQFFIKKHWRGNRILKVPYKKSGRGEGSLRLEMVREAHL